ncbi:hypothetical protein BC937DRAFT_89443 [Endogone sp. FLAS-F59071]|nr:hypothetical protein BC937DRAFT_89443 [Endogone sp. FLAS-F59071]|eukprot:RUS22395.1 hypothetical protein BC937DRAFT_89443 [Endogone sp. FLAS-F59071]
MFRVSYLVDVAYLTLESVTQLARTLREHSRCQMLCALQFGDRYTFICHRHLLASHIKVFLRSANGDCSTIATEDIGPIFIDVSEALAVPSRSSTAPISLHTFISATLRLFVYNSSETVLFITDLPLCLIALTGWILEYPIIYIQNEEQEGERGEWQSRSNCLGNVRLTVVRLKLLGGSHGRQGSWER